MFDEDTSFESALEDKAEQIAWQHISGTFDPPLNKNELREVDAFRQVAQTWSSNDVIVAWLWMAGVMRGVGLYEAPLRYLTSWALRTDADQMEHAIRECENLERVNRNKNINGQIWFSLSQKGQDRYGQLRGSGGSYAPQNSIQSPPSQTVVEHPAKAMELNEPSGGTLSNEEGETPLSKLVRPGAVRNILEALERGRHITSRECKRIASRPLAHIRYDVENNWNPSPLRDQVLSKLRAIPPA